MLVNVPRAEAAPQKNYCVWTKTNGSWYGSVKYAAWRWSQSKHINVYMKNTGCPKGATIIQVTTEKLPSKYAALSGYYTKKIRLNTDYNRYSTSQKNSIVGHEFGHVFGLKHTSWGIMAYKPYGVSGPSEYFLNRAR